MSQADPFKHFSKALLPADLQVSSLARLQSLGRLHEVERGELAQLNGHGCRWVVFLSKGAAKLVAHVGADREQIVCFAFGGDLLALSPASQAQFALQALTQCRLIAFPAQEFMQAATESGEAACMIFERSLLALDRAREKSVLLGRKTAHERMASFLLSMAGRIGKPQGEIISLNLPMSRREIADSLGLTIETVSRQLTELRNHGIIRTQGRSEVIILDRVRLSKSAALASCIG